MSERIPGAVCAVVGEVIGTYYFSHTKLNTLLAEHGVPGDPPPGNCVTKVTDALRRVSTDPQTDALGVLGGLLRDYMETVVPYLSGDQLKNKDRIDRILGQYGLSYQLGGRILEAGRTAPVVALEKALGTRDLLALEQEHRRALDNVASDPGATVTAASSLLESLFKTYIHDERLDMPSDQSIKPLWRVVQLHLGLDPAAVADDDIRRILGAMSALVDGIGSLRTHAGSAHGHGRAQYRLGQRHATLAVNGAYTLATFVIQTWNERVAGGDVRPPRASSQPPGR